MFGINTTDLMILIFIAVFIVGPERMPRYAKELAGYVRKIREMSESAKGQMKEELGEEYSSIADLKKFDPRQYDPRKIIKDALAEEIINPVQEMKNTVVDDVINPARDMVQDTTAAATGKKIPSAATETGSETGASDSAEDVAAGVSAGNSPEENVRIARKAASQRPAYVELAEGATVPFDPEAT